MQKQVFDLKELSLPKTTRSNSSSNFTKTFYRPLKSKIYHHCSSQDEIHIQLLSKRPVPDYLSMLSPIKDLIDIDPKDHLPETKEQIIEQHKIKELILEQDKKRRVRSIQGILAGLEDSPVLNKLFNSFRVLSAKVAFMQILKERMKGGYVFYLERLLESEDIAIDLALQLITQQQLNASNKKELEILQFEHKKSASDLKTALFDLREFREKYSKDNKKFKETNTYIEKKEKAFNIEKAQLETEIELLKFELHKEFNKDKPSADIKQQSKSTSFEELYKEYKNKYEQSSLSYTKLQHELGQVKDQKKLLQNIVDSYQEVKSALENQIKVVDQAYLNLELQFSCLNERISMQQEEILCTLNIHSELTAVKLEKSLLQSKLSHLEVLVHSGTIHIKDSEDFIPATDPVFQLIQNPEKYKPRKVRRDSRLRTLDPSNVNLTALKPCKPTFASLLKIPTGKVAYNPPSPDWLFTTLRAILDSKYYEHVLCTQGNYLPCTFPEFVYDWLGMFYVDNTSRSVKQLEWWSKNNADDFRVQVLAGVSLTRSKKVWELNTFREFLTEELDLDELGFFLHCRFLLFAGPQLSHSAGRCVAMHYVSLYKAKELVTSVMDGLSHEGMAQLLALIEQKSHRKKNMVESGFVLRTLLEYYHREKKLKFLAIQDLFYKSSNTEFNFQTFKDICISLDANLSPYLIAKSYRDAFMEGNGFISPEIFFIVANNILFYHMLRLKNPWKIPKMNEFGEIDATFNTYSEYMAKADSLFVKNKKDVEIVTKFVESIGVPDFQRHISKLEGILHRKYQVLEDFKHWNLADVFKQFWLSILRMKSVFYECNSLVSINTHKGILNKELEMVEIMKANQLFIQDIYLINLNAIASKILLRKFQKRTKSRKSDLTKLRNVVKSITLMKQKRDTLQ